MKINSLIFLSKCMHKRLIIKLLKRNGTLHLFRRLEVCSEKQIKCETAIEFLKLCQNLGVTPTFAKINSTAANKWRKSSKQYEENVISEEFREKTKVANTLKATANNIYKEIREKCTILQYIGVLNAITNLRKKQYESIMDTHTKKLSRLLYKEGNIDEYINNLSSCHLSFFQKLVLFRGLDFSLPQKTSGVEIQAAFEKVYWNVESSIADDKKELASATLKSIALNYIEQYGPKPPKSLLRSIGQLRKRDDIIVTKPDKGSGVVVMNKSEYIQLLRAASINDSTKFKPINEEQPKSRGSSPKFYHPLLEKEKETKKIVKRILPKETAELLTIKGSRLAHLYGLPKTHKNTLSIRPVLSATETYNYKLAKW